MGLTKKQKDTLIAIGKKAQNFHVRGTKARDRVVNVDERLSTIYHSFLEHLEWIDEYYPIFERRLRRDNVEVKERLVRLNRRISKSVKERRYR